MEDDKKIESPISENDNEIVSVELTKEQYAFLTNLQKKQEKELGIEIPIGALVRKTVETAMNSDARPERGDRPERPRDGGRPSFGDRPRPSFGGGSRDGGRPSFGDRPRPSFGGGSRDGGSRDGGRPSFGDRPRPSFGGGSRGGDRPRPSFGGRDGGSRGGAKFDMLGIKNKTKKFDE